MRTSLLSTSLAGALAFSALATGCRSTPKAERCTYVEDGFGPAGTVPVRAETVVEGLEVPWSLAFLPPSAEGRAGDVLVTERPGRLRLVRDGALVPQPLATIEVDPGGEGGLQGLALHPDFASTRQFFLYFTAQKDGEKVNRLERWVLSEDRRSALFEKRLMDDLPGARFHHGGRIRIGPDRMLYVSVGDAREPALAQDLRSPAGAILRLGLEGEIPSDNPTPGSPIFISGVRNSQGFDWLSDDRLIVTDHGPSGDTLRFGHDRVQVASAGENLGWPETYGCEVKAGYVPAIISWKSAAPPGGAAIYRGDAIPEWKGSLLIGTLKSRHLQRVQLSEDGTAVALHEVYLEGEPPNGLGRIREVVNGPDGHLWVTTSNCDGRGECGPNKDRIVRILPAR